MFVEHNFSNKNRADKKFAVVSILKKYIIDFFICLVKFTENNR